MEAPSGPPCAFYLTGFGPFGGCLGENPSAALAAALAAPPPSAGGAAVLGAEVLPVDAAAVRPRLAELYPQLARRAEAGGSRVIVVHLGVALSTSSVRLERRAVNEADFRLPDVAGWRPRRERIVDADACGAALYTDLPLRAVQRRLARAGHPVALSRDAGRYVCNYAYYEALRAAAAAAPLISALFVHVPPFAAVPAAAQEAALRALLAELAREGAADAVGERRAPWRRCACL